MIVRVSSDGQIHAETQGTKGPKCLDSIELLERLLDAQTTESAFTSEYYEAASTTMIEGDDELPQR